MPKTVQIRDIDDEVYAGLRRRAAEVGVSVPALLRMEAIRLATRPSVAAWLARTRRRHSTVGTEEILESIDAGRRQEFGTA